MKLNLGCGSRILKGWLNIDSYPRPLWCSANYLCHNLGEQLPVEDETVDFIYCEHFIEKLNFDDCLAVFREFFRVLKKDGVIRISTPDLDFVSKTLKIAQPNAVYQLYEISKLKENLWVSGFIHVVECEYGVSKYPELCGLEHKPSEGELIVEAKKFVCEL